MGLIRRFHGLCIYGPVQDRQIPNILRFSSRQTDSQYFTVQIKPVVFPLRWWPRRRESSPRGADGVSDLTRARGTRSIGCERRGPTVRASGLAGVFKDCRCTPRHVSPLRWSHTLRRGAAQAAVGGHHRRWVSSSDRYTANRRSPRLSVTSVIALYVEDPRKWMIGATIADG